MHEKREKCTYVTYKTARWFIKPFHGDHAFENPFISKSEYRYTFQICIFDLNNVRALKY